MQLAARRSGVRAVNGEWQVIRPARRLSKARESTKRRFTAFPCNPQDRHSRDNTLSPPLTSAANPTFDSAINTTEHDGTLVYPKSLEQTLKAHREANEQALPIRRQQWLPRSDSDLPLPMKSTDAVSTRWRSLRLSKTAQFDGKTSLDYTGEPADLAFDWELVGGVSRYLKLPWMRRLDAAGPARQDALERLGLEIDAAELFLSPDPQEQEAADKIYTELCHHIQKSSPACDYHLDLIGSRANGLASPLSDLDVNLVTGANDDEPAAVLAALRSLYSATKFHPSNGNPIAISHFVAKARVPLIGGSHRPTGLEFQIQSARTGYATLHMVKSLCVQLPQIRSLFKIVKHMLKIRNLTYGPGGGLTSYPLLIMVSVAAKMRPDLATGTPRDLARSLLHFFDLWSSVDFYTTGITHLPAEAAAESNLSLHDVKKYFRDDETAVHTYSRVLRDPVNAKPVFFTPKGDLGVLPPVQKNFNMALHNPANPFNDLGRSCSKIKHIQATLLDIRAKLQDDISEWDRMMRADSSAPEKPPSLLRALIQGDYTMHNLERTRLRAYVPRDVVKKPG